jgi:hypothetical protein
MLLADLDVAVVELTAAQSRTAREAYRRFGKGRHPAGLNLGDCCAYALALTLDEPLLFKGDDFPHTDVPACPIMHRATGLRSGEPPAPLGAASPTAGDHGRPRDCADRARHGAPPAPRALQPCCTIRRRHQPASGSQRARVV